MALDKKTQALVEGAFESIVERALKEWNEMVEEIDLEKALYEISNQTGWNGKTYGGNWGREAGIEIFAGGMSESVFQNFLYKLKIRKGIHTSLELTMLEATILKIAMSKSDSLNMFVEALLSGAMVVGRNFSDKREAAVYYVLKS
ncbi:MAG: hypothetical protein HQ536_00840 [Parcubacteria group bacterium]|nr:hypothetical protein [Parcubacteria group bacterium]